MHCIKKQMLQFQKKFSPNFEKHGFCILFTNLIYWREYCCNIDYDRCNNTSAITYLQSFINNLLTPWINYHISIFLPRSSLFNGRFFTKTDKCAICCCCDPQKTYFHVKLLRHVENDTRGAMLDSKECHHQ